MFYSYPQETLQEVPNEISLALSISGCPLRCKGCHSTENYNPEFGDELSVEILDSLLIKHKHISCVLFYGGEWDINNLLIFLKYIKVKGLKTALYSGYELSFFNKIILEQLDYIKVGSYKEKFGGINQKTTNQRMFKLNKSIIEDNITSTFQ